MRTKTRKRTDRRVFRKTASYTKAINVKPISMRGGIRM